MSKKKDLTGKRFGRLTVMYEVEPYVSSNGGKRSKWHCLCDCGNEINVIGGDLKSGHTQSCGCFQKYMASKASIKHGYAKNGHKLYVIWVAIKGRCYNKSNNRYKDYGGRGIKMCNEWKNDAGKFIDWCLGNGWKDGLQIDRIDNDIGYYPDNCHFVTAKENNMNKRFLQKNNVSGYRGVHWHKRDKMWYASISVNGERFYLGRFDAKKDAAIAYNKAAKKYGYPLNKIDGSHYGN